MSLANERRDRIADWVFGRVTAVHRPTLLRIGALVLMLAAGVLLLLFRLEGVDRGLIWAEDGRDFLSAAYVSGIGSTLFEPYAGYIHVVPRLASEFVATFAPLDQVGYWINTLGALVWSGAAVVTFVFTRGRLRMPLRVLAWLFVLILPIGSMEVATNIANAHWFLDFAVLMVFFSRSGSTARIVLGSVVAVAAATSDPLSIIVLPLVLVRLALIPKLRENIVSIAFVAALVLQLVIDTTTTRNQSPAFFPLGLSKIYVVRVVWQTFTGPLWGTQIERSIGLVVPVIVGLLIVLALVAVIVRHRPEAGFAAVTLAASIFFTLLVSVLTWKVVSAPALGQEVYWGSRYWVVPSLLLIMAVLGAMEAALPTGALRWNAPTVVSAVVLLVLLASSVSNFQTPGYKVGPDQPQKLREVEDFCAEHPAETAAVQIAPSPWTLPIPCVTVNSR